VSGVIGSRTRTLFGTGGYGLSVKGPTAVAGLLVFAGYCVGAQLGFALKFEEPGPSVLWPPNAILLAALVLSSYRSWPALILCALPAHLLIELNAGLPGRMVLCLFVSNASEGLIGATAMRLLMRGPVRLNRLRTMAILILCAGIIGPFLSSFLDAAFVHWNTGGQKQYWRVWNTRFPSNVFTEVIIAPVIVSWATARFELLTGAGRLRYLEGVLMSVGLIVSSAAVFYWQTPGNGTIPMLVYAPMPFLIWAAARFGPPGGSAAILWVALQAIWGAMHGRGPFHTDAPQVNAFFIQIFFAAATCTLMLLAASVSEGREAQERFTKAFGSSPDAVILTRLEDGRIIEVSRKWQEMLGYERDETVGRTVYDLHIYPSEADRTSLINRLVKQGSLNDIEASFRAKNGEFRNVLMSGNTEEIDGEMCLIVTFRDITDRRRAEEAEHNLAHASRLALAGELTAMVAHEVKQPLGAILSNADTAEILLSSENPPLDEIRQIISDIRENDLRADSAVRRISLLLRKKEMKPEALDVRELISDTIHLTAPDAVRRQVSVRFQQDGTFGAGWGDRMHLQQVLVNLILNGMDAAEDQPPSRRSLVIRAKGVANDIEVSISDLAGGIPVDKMSKIFESFFTTKENGMGLGLAIARSIIEAHKGKIWAENNADGGATVHFTIASAKKFRAHESGN
jgi:two-component system sensor kinase FixL